MNFQLMDIESLVDCLDIQLAHVDGCEKIERLEVHMDRSIKYFNILCEEKNIDKIVYGIVQNIQYEGEKIDADLADCIFNMFINAIYLHDIGKINPSFQHIKLNNGNVEYKNISEGNNTNHSELSALIYTDIFLNYIEKNFGMKDWYLLRSFVYSFSYTISRHHTYLDNAEEKQYYEELKQLLKRLNKNSSYLTYYKFKERLLKMNSGKIDNRVKEGFNCFDFYILTKLLYSCIVACDFYATNYYMAGKEIEFHYINNIDSIINEFKKSEIYKGIEEYKKNPNYFGSNSINTLRTQMFLEAEENLLKQKEKNVYYLEAPTGSGKTITSINLALNIIKNDQEFKKIFYVFPFNALIEQTKKNFDGLFSEQFQKNNKVAVINSVTPVITESEWENGEEYIDYDKFYLDRLFVHYPIVLTSHVNFFNYLFGTGREVNLPLVHLCNSVVIIDEIQSYKNSIWPEIIRFLDKYSELLNIKIIIMSATLPKLDSLLKKFTDVNTESVKLIENREKYFKNRMFKDRVKIDYEMLKLGTIDKQILLEKVENVVKDKNYRVLIEFIYRNSAYGFYKLVQKEFPNKKVFLLTGDDNKLIRKNVLNEICEKDTEGEFVAKDFILVSTQVIEAGVDIDVDIGFKDISILDNEEQFLGRINRSCKRDFATAYFFNMDNAANIYRGDFRLEKNLLQEDYQSYLREKNFEDFYELCFKRLYENKKEANQNSIKGFYNNLQVLNFKNIQEKMKLIDDNSHEIYLPYVYKDENNCIDGRNIWENYKGILTNNTVNYSEKMIVLSEVSSKMQLFLFSSRKRPGHYTEKIGNIYYVENGEEYITEDYKFDREKYEKSYEGAIL